MLLVSEEQIKEYSYKGYWGSKTIVDLVYEHAYEALQEETLVDPYNRKNLVGGEPKRLTNQQLIEAVDRLAVKLLELGIKKDDVIAVQLPNIVELVISYLAIARVGGIITPLGVQYRTHEVENALKQCAVVAYITTLEFNKFNYIDMIQAIAPKYPNLKHVISVGADLPENVLSFEEIISTPIPSKYSDDYLDGRQSGPNEVFTICWTSGTEADPKGAPRSHNHWIITGTLNTTICLLPPRCTVLASFPLINMAGIGAALMTWVVNGGKLVLHHPFDAPTLLQQIPGEKIYYTMAPPALLIMLDQLPAWADLDKSSLKVLATGGSPLPSWIVKKYREAYNMDIVNEFASNEGLGILSSELFFSDLRDLAIYFPRWGVEGIEWPKLKEITDDYSCEVMHSTQTKIADPQSGKTITERGIAGEMRYKGPGVFAGYWKRPDLTAKVFDEEGYYCTGDLFSIEGENADKYLFKGRYKDLIIRGGQNISPEEVENLVGEHPKVLEVAAIGCPDERLGERVCVVVVPVPGETISLDEITDFVKAKETAIYKMPERLEVVESMPRNALNKIEKRTLRKRFGFE